MKKTLLAFLFVTLFSFFNLRAEDSTFMCAGWNLYGYSFGSPEIEEIPGNVVAMVSVEEEVASLGLLDADDEELLDLFLFLDFSYSGSEVIEGITFDVFNSIVVSVGDDSEGEINLYINRSGDADLIYIDLGGETIAYVGQQVVPNAVGKLKKLSSLMDAGSSNLAKALQRAF